MQKNVIVTMQYYYCGMDNNSNIAANIAVAYYNLKPSFRLYMATYK